jgi:hypothetical protein
MPIFFLERDLESPGDVILSHFTRKLDQELPPVVIGELRYMNSDNLTMFLRDEQQGCATSVHDSAERILLRLVASLVHR